MNLQLIFSVVGLLMACTELAAQEAIHHAAFRDCARCPLMQPIPSPIDGEYKLAVSSTPITFAEWTHCFADKGCAAYRPDRQGWPSNSSVVNISFDDAQNFIAWLSKKSGHAYRLPYENEWGHMAWGGQKTVYPWGDALGKANTNCLDCGSPWDGKRTSPVRSFAPNRFVLYDITGNVSHWVQASPSANASNKPFCKTPQTYAAIMGASWADPAKFLGVSEWTCFPKVLRDDSIGFRVVRENTPQ